MPLLKNGEVYTLTAPDKKRVRDFVDGKFPVKFKMPPEWFKQDKINPGRIIRPVGVNINHKCVISEDGQLVLWRYSRVFRKSRDGKEILSDTSEGMTSFETELLVTATEMDKLFYLLFCCPARKGSEHATDPTNYSYVVENIEKEAGVELEKESKLAAAVHYLTNEWAERRVRLIASAMGIPFAMEADKMGDKEVRRKVVQMVKLNDKQLAIFDGLSMLDHEIKIRACVQALSDKNLIRYEDPTWKLLKFNTNKNVYERAMEICDLQPGMNPTESVVNFLKKNPKQWEIVSTYDEQTAALMADVPAIIDEPMDAPTPAVNKGGRPKGS